MKCTNYITFKTVCLYCCSSADIKYSCFIFPLWIYKLPFCLECYMMLCNFSALKSSHESCTCWCITIKILITLCQSSNTFRRCNFKCVHQGAARTELLLRSREQDLGVAPAGSVSSSMGWGPTGAQSCRQRWVLVTGSTRRHRQVSGGLSPGSFHRNPAWRRSRVGQRQGWRQRCSMRPKSIQETAYLQELQEKAHRAWVYAWGRARSSRCNKTQAVTHIAPPCTLEVFYLADR